MPLATPQIEETTHAVSTLSKVGIIIPTYNAESYWPALHDALDRQGVEPEQILIIDSSSTDRTRDLAQKAGYRVMRIDQRDFSHGGTRQLAGDRLPWAEFLLYLTQDALPAEDSFEKLCATFEDLTVGAAYGRQIPRRAAGAIERHARLFNYPLASSVRTFESRCEVGIKTAFLSNSFAAYRRSALEQVGGFPSHVIMAEDSFVAARMLMEGWKVAYVADASVVHSHPLSVKQEFCRYFDTGVHHAREQWVLDAFGEAGGEGKRFLRSEFSYLLARQPYLLPVAALRTMSKFVAYKLGRHERRLALPIKSYLSSQPAFWSRTRTSQAGVQHGAEMLSEHPEVHQGSPAVFKP